MTHLVTLPFKLNRCSIGW